MANAVIAGHGEIGIAVSRHAHLLGCARATAATAREHGCHGMVTICQHQPRGCERSAGGVTSGRRRLAEKLTVGGVTEIKIVMTSPGGDEIRTSGHGLRL